MHFLELDSLSPFEFIVLQKKKNDLTKYENDGHFFFISFLQKYFNLFSYECTFTLCDEMWKEGFLNYVKWLCIFDEEKNSSSG